MSWRGIEKSYGLVPLLSSKSTKVKNKKNVSTSFTFSEKNNADLLNLSN